MTSHCNEDDGSDDDNNDTTASQWEIVTLSIKLAMDVISGSRCITKFLLDIKLNDRRTFFPHAKGGYLFPNNHDRSILRVEANMITMVRAAATLEEYIDLFCCTLGHQHITDLQVWIVGQVSIMMAVLGDAVKWMENMSKEYNHLELFLQDVSITMDRHRSH